MKFIRDHCRVTLPCFQAIHLGLLCLRPAWLDRLQWLSRTLHTSLVKWEGAQ